MSKGKNTCRILKDIRRQIAEANVIEFITSECKHQGDCLGTCPKCEEEVHYLEQQLNLKLYSGKTVTLIGLFAGFIGLSAMATSYNHSPKPSSEALQDSIGITVDSIAQDTCRTDTLSNSFNPALGETIPETSPTPRITPTVPIIDNGLYTDQSIDIVASTPDSAITFNKKDTLMIAEVMPRFPGGQDSLERFIAKNIIYPKAANEINVQGRVIIRFVVDKEGNVTHPQILRSLHPLFDEEALRIINMMPKWKPGESPKGVKVPVYYIVPVKFKLLNKSKP